MISGNFWQNRQKFLFLFFGNFAKLNCTADVKHRIYLLQPYITCIIKVIYWKKRKIKINLLTFLYNVIQMFFSNKFFITVSVCLGLNFKHPLPFETCMYIGNLAQIPTVNFYYCH